MTCPVKQRTRAGGWRTFERRFQPMLRDGELLFWEHEHLPAGIDPHLVWTIIDAEGRIYVTPGFRFVNRVGYVRCAKSWTEADREQPDYVYGSG